MKAVMVMFDSLRRDLLSCNGGPIPTPNFERLAKHTVQFDCSYVGSMPCMPARRELHTGRYNFLHRSWGPIEPFDDSMPEILKMQGVHTHLTTDHFHYLEDGGATYHGRYSTWDFHRGQEDDKWIADLTPHGSGYSPYSYGVQNMKGPIAKIRQQGGWQNVHNREAIQTDSDFPMHKTFDNGIDFLERNAKYDQWFLQIETYDPHEPFTSPERFERRYFSPDNPFVPDWPTYGKADENDAAVINFRKKYYALVQFCDQQLGRVLDKMDELDLWQDTMLIVNTDHGFFLAEHDWLGKGSPCYEELVHTPLFFWDPRLKIKDTRCPALVQTIDIAPTLLDYFGAKIPKDMLGQSLSKALMADNAARQYALFGYYGASVGITDGTYTLFRAPANTEVPIYEYTHMPATLMGFFSIETMRTMTASEPFSFTKEAPLMKVSGRPHPGCEEETEDLLFDLKKDPGQKNPIDDEGVKQRLLAAMAELFYQNDAPAELYARYGLATK